MVTKLSPNNTTQRVMDILTVEDFDSVGFWVGNAYKSAYYFYNALGFKPVAWSSLKTGNRVLQVMFLSPTIVKPEIKIERIDHVVGNVNWFQMEPYVKFYHEVFGFEKFMEFSEKDIATQYSTLRSQVVRNYNHKVLMPINEPWHGIKTSQIEEYVTYYHGAGVQHIALHTSDISQGFGKGNFQALFEAIEREQSERGNL